MGAYGISRLVASAMHQAYLRRSAGPDQLMIEEGQEGGVLALQEFKPRGLVVFPYVQELAECIEAKRKSLTTPQVWLKVGATESRFKLLCPKIYDAICKGEGASPPAGAVAKGQGASPAAGSVAQGEGASPAASEPGAGATEEEATPSLG